MADQTYYAAHRERILANVKARYAAKREEIRAYKREYQQRNRQRLAEEKRAAYAIKRDEISAKAKAAYAKNPDYWKAKSAAYEHANPEKAKAAHQRWRAEHRDHLKEVKRAYNAKRAGHFREWHQQYYQANRDRLIRINSASSKAWRLANPERHVEKEARRRALKRQTQVEKIDFRKILIESNGFCGICRKPLDLFGTEFDHIMPLAHGGTHTYGNIQVAHARCNRAKGAKVA